MSSEVYPSFEAGIQARAEAAMSAFAADRVSAGPKPVHAYRFDRRGGR